MNELSLGTLRPVEPRTMWPNEAADFTPWLAHPDNITRLGEAIGLELEVEHTEVAVGPFAADILARESGTGSYVIIENQLNRGESKGTFIIFERKMMNVPFDSPGASPAFDGVVQGGI